jgi:predicted RNA-binding Zn ribbon-like protein
MGFVFVSGRPSLDLAGTRKWRRRESPEEQLTDPALLSAWACQAGLVDEPFPVGDRELAQAIELREAIYRIVTGRMASRPVRDADAASLNLLARGHPIAPELTTGGEVRRRATAPELLTSVALDALDLLGGADLARLRECADADCTRVYLDMSRSRNRRWCGMAECGNRAKVDAYRRRQVK